MANEIISYLEMCCSVYSGGGPSVARSTLPIRRDRLGRQLLAAEPVRRGSREVRLLFSVADKGGAESKGISRNQAIAIGWSKARAKRTRSLAPRKKGGARKRG